MNATKLRCNRESVLLIMAESMSFDVSAEQAVSDSGAN